MKKSMKRSVSKLLAGIMLVSSVFSTTFVSGADGDVLAYVEDAITSTSAFEVSTTSWNFRSGSTIIGENGSKIQGSTGELAGLQIDATASSAKFDATRTDWAQVNTGTIVKVPASEAVNVSVDTYSTGVSLTIGDKTVTSKASDGSNVASANATPTDGYVTIVMNSDDYFGSITLGAPVEEASVEDTTETTTSSELPTINVSEEKSFTVWLDDFATVETADDGAGGTVTTKTAEPGYYVGGGAVVEFVPGINGEKYTASSTAKAWNLTFDGKSVSGFKAGNRPTECNAYSKVPDAGTSIVVTPTVKGIVTVYGASTSFFRVNTFNDPATAPEGYVDSDQGASADTPLEYSFQAEPGKTYVIATTGKTNNCFFAGVEFVADEDIDVNFSYEDGDTEQDYSAVPVEIIDTKLGTVVATITKADSSLSLAKGHTYKVNSTDSGVGVSVDGADTFKADGSAVKLTFVNIPDVVLSGKFEFEGDAVDVQSVTFTKMTNSAVSYTASVEDGTIVDGGYSLNIKPGEYNTSVVANGYTTYDRASVAAEGESVDNVYLESLVMSKYDLPTEVGRGVSNLTLNNISPNNATSVKGVSGSSIVVPVSGKQVVTAAGWYAGTWDINGQGSVTADSNSNASNPVTTSYTTDGTETSVTVNITAEGTSYLYWISVTDVDAATFKSEVSVPGDYATLKEANEAIKAMDRPEGEDGRVTINLTADLQEQVVFDAPYITVNGNGHEINWYYGTTGSYYSIDSNGLYSETLFRDKYELVSADQNTTFGAWGGVVIVRGAYFRAEDVTFRNTFNYEVTDKEIEDGATQNAALRTKNTDVATKAYKERSNAFYIEADNIELKNCKILSSQDTFGRNGSTNYNYHIYLKDCVIAGNVDYICGEFTALFDNCELQWRTYSDTANNAAVGYITAAKTSPYIFRNCTVTADSASNEGVSGGYGRTWGSNSCAYFVNTETNGLIASTAWGEMTSGDGATAKFFEYGNTSNGVAFESNPEAAVKGTQVTDETEISKLTTDNIIEAYLANWTPYYYDEAVVIDGIYGDVDNSGILTANDAAAVLAYTLDPAFAGVENYNFTVADVDNVKGITSNDAACILQKVLDGAYALPVEAGNETTTEATTETTTEAPVKDDLANVNVFVVGDSTACHYAESTDKNYYVKRTGYGDKLADYLYGNATVVNLALSGRSSKSFITDPEYQTLLSSVKEGDFVLIGFGHNDEKITEADRGTTPGGSKDDEGTFKNSVYTNFIQPVQAAGATPILVTPIVRRSATDDYTGSVIHQTNGGDYAQDMIDLGAELGLTVVDATGLTKSLYTELTADKTQLLHAWTGIKSIDNTHLNVTGASYVSYLIASTIKSSDSKLAPYVQDGITAPTLKELSAVANPDYEEPKTDDPEDLTSVLWTTTSPWYGTVTGDIGGEDKLFATNEDGSYDYNTLAEYKVVKTGEMIKKFLIEENSDGSVNIRAGIPAQKQSFGKIASTSDGFAMYYQPVNASTNFEISGTITVNDYISNNQVALGAIVADSIKVDTYSVDTYQYVAGGVYKIADIGADIEGSEEKNAGMSSYARIDGTLNNGTRSITSLQKGDQIQVSIKKVGDVFTVTTNGVTDTYTLPMSGDVYVGFYAARSADITVSNINFNNEVVE